MLDSALICQSVAHDRRSPAALRLWRTRPSAVGINCRPKIQFWPAAATHNMRKALAVPT